MCGRHRCVANLPAGCAGFPMRGRRVGMAAEALTVSLEVLNLTVTLRRQREASDRRTIPNMLFTSSVLLARWIVRHEELFQHKRVLELGAGLGLAGACVRERCPPPPDAGRWGALGTGRATSPIPRGTHDEASLQRRIVAPRTKYP